MADAFTLKVIFDDGPEIEVAVKQRDILRLEELDRELVLTEDGIALGMRHMPMAAWLALSREKRRGTLPDDVPLPDTFDEFRDICDIEVEGDEAPDPSNPARSTGS